MVICTYFQVLSVLDSNYHIFNDVKKSSVVHATEKRLYDHNVVRASEYKEKISIFVPYIGISLIDSYPQVTELNWQLYFKDLFYSTVNHSFISVGIAFCLY